MNNKIAESIRNSVINQVFTPDVLNELIQIDTGKFVIPVSDEKGIISYCEIDFIAKKEGYTPDYDINKFAEKVVRMEKANKELKERKQKKTEKTAKKSE